MKRSHSPDTQEDPPEKRLTLAESEPQERSVTTLSYTVGQRVPERVLFQQPQQLLTFSYTPEHVLEFTDSGLRYFVDPPSGADLKYGYDRWIKRPEEKGRLDSLLRAVSKIRTKMGDSGQDWLKSIGVVSWRGVMTK